MIKTNTGPYSRIRYFTSLLVGEASRGGRANTISNAYSSILGGSGNTVTHAYSAAFGNGVSSLANNTFHVECLNAVNTPGPYAFPPALPGGTVYWGPAGSLGKTLYII
jgi:hypothetical protein